MTTEPLSSLDGNQPVLPPPTSNSNSNSNSNLPQNDGVNTNDQGYTTGAGGVAYPKQQVGVADYFATLGVGEELVWRHAQKQQQSSSNAAAAAAAAAAANDPESLNVHAAATDTTDATAAATAAATSVVEENDARLLERFYREIVDCAIWVADERTTSNSDNYYHHHHASNSNTHQHQHLQQQQQHPTTVVYTDTANTNRPSYPVTLPISPSPSDVTYSVVGTADVGEGEGVAGAGAGAGGETTVGELIEGWTVLQQTRPLSAPLTPAPSPENPPSLWSRGQVWDANLDPIHGLTGHFVELAAEQQRQLEGRQGKTTKSSTPLKDLRQKVQSSFQQRLVSYTTNNIYAPTNGRYSHKKKFYLTFRQRSPDESTRPAIADLELLYVRLHKATIIPTAASPPFLADHNEGDDDDAGSVKTSRTAGTTAAASTAGSTVSQKGAAALLRVAEAGKQTFQSRVLGQVPPTQAAAAAAIPSLASQGSAEEDFGEPVALASLLKLPAGLQEWSIPEPYRELRFPTHPPSTTATLSSTTSFDNHNNSNTNFTRSRMYKTVLFPPKEPEDMDASSSGVEAVERERSIRLAALSPTSWRDRLEPKLYPVGTRMETMMTNMDDTSNTHHFDDHEEEDGEFILVPILAMRRQRIGEEERFHEDPAIVEMTVSFIGDDDHNYGSSGKPVLPYEEVDPFEEEDDDAGMTLLEKSAWAVAYTHSNSGSNSPTGHYNHHHHHHRSETSHRSLPLGTTCILVRRNAPLGFCDAAFSTSVLDRFPYKNYKGLPLPEEELPMFCYPTGCRLHRAKFCDAPLPQYYGFVVKNERGDSIYVSCVSFMELLTQQKRKQLDRLSEHRRRVSLPHARFWAKRERRRRRPRQGFASSPPDSSNDLMIDFFDHEDNNEDDKEEESNMLLTGFDEMTTFENKTICLVSRYPYWSAFRRFLSHLHSISGSTSDLPLERYISHLLLAVPIPKPGGPSVLIPLPTFNVPMMLWLPPSKDLPLLDLPYERLVSCLDIPTIVTVVLGFLALERKVIVMSTRPSLVLDVCELLRSLLFPFDLCAPYVPRLTEPFMSCLDFPGAIFVGIHDDGTPTGLAAVVRENMPEDSTIVDLDSGTVDCSGDRMTVLKSSWGIIPPGPRSNLVSEIETLCRDAGIVPGQEPLDSLVDPAFEATMPSTPVQDTGTLKKQHKVPLDDRAVRDAFLRFFCSVLGGYERYLVVPDVDFLISGNEWFDAKGFLAAASEEKAAFLGTLVSTQLFQSFIQRRTEASDVHCLLFDECLAEFHSSSVPYGRLGGDVETVHTAENEHPQLLYSLLVDQSASEATQSIVNEKSFDGDSKHGSDTDSSGVLFKSSVLSSEIGDGILRHTEFAKNATGDWVMLPSRSGLPVGARFLYCVDGNPTFPDRLNPNSYLPRQPESWLVEMTTVPTPMLTRSGKEIEEADRRRKLATTYRGLPTQRRCLWQLPKLMGSHFLGAWLLCIPALVAQPFLTHEQQSKYLLRALGALRLLRSKQRIVPDEAAYRALIVACGRTRSDRRMELVKLFGLLRSDGIFPSAVTLGQYTKALAEGYSKQRSTGLPDDENWGVEVTESLSRDMAAGSLLKDCIDSEATLASLDTNLFILEDSGRRWRQKSLVEKETSRNHEEPASSNYDGGKGGDRTRKKSSRPWLPVATSWSLAPSRQEDPNTTKAPHLALDQTRLVAMWSRTKSCRSCGYVPLEEEVQAGWDVVGGENDIPGAINCPRCGELLVPSLGYRALSVEAAVAISSKESSPLSQIPPSRSDASDATADFAILPPQMRSTIEEIREASYVTYLSPATLRSSLERYIEEHGEEVLERDRLREIAPEVFYNLWWYSARFSLPLPLPVSSAKNNKHYCGMVGWDYQVALRGCVSAAMVMTSLFDTNNAFSNEDTGTTSSKGASENGPSPSTAEESNNSLEAFGDHPLLARFNLQGYYSTVWDHEDLSKVLVTLVEACDKRDFRPVVECLLRVNKRRRAKFSGVVEPSLTSSMSNGQSGSDVVTTNSLALNPTPTRSDGNDSLLQSVELECYRTALYLAKYQCTSAFHAFFPATIKPCKGYHFWCPISTLSIFDRLLHEAVKRARSKSNGYVPFHDISDVALGFRSVFGHLM